MRLRNRLTADHLNGMIVGAATTMAAFILGYVAALLFSTLVL